MLSSIGSGLLEALSMAFGMTWEILWALILGFALSGAIQAVVSKGEMTRLLPDDSPRSIGIACGLGAASSSCSYAAVALARSIFRKGANFTAAMVFEFASTNLVIELGIIMAIVVGLLLAGALAAWVPYSFWQSFFLADQPGLSTLWGVLVGPLIAVLSFVCSIGNVPLAAVLWNGGMSFGGVMAFIFADLIVLPILNIYRKYYGGRVSLFLFATFYAAMAAAGLIVDLVFEALGLVPTHRNARVVEASIQLNYTTVLNLIFLILAAVLVWRFFKKGGAWVVK